MRNTRFKVNRFTCLVCGRTWASIKHDGIPKRCGNPKCRKTTWHRPPVKRKGAA